MSDQEIVDTYFEVNDTEFLNRGMSLIDIPSFDVLLAIAHKNAGAAANDEPTYPQDADDSTEGRDRCSVCDRSEEHTSELQSLMRISYAVFCLKKKTLIRSVAPCTSTD